MSIGHSRVLTALSFALLATPALADDCVAARSAIADTTHTPVSTTSTKTDAQGKQSVTRMIQTATHKYVQTASDGWDSLNISIQDLIDTLNATKLSCRRSGSDSVNGEPAAVYDVRMEQDGTISDTSIWVSSRSNLIMKAEQGAGGARHTTVYDYSHVTPPAGATEMGLK